MVQILPEVYAPLITKFKPILGENMGNIKGISALLVYWQVFSMLCRFVFINTEIEQRTG